MDSKRCDWKQLKEFKMFSDIDETLLKSIADSMKLRCCEKDEIICDEDSVASSMFFIYRGKVVVIKKAVPMAVLSEGDYFGEMSILEGKGRAASVKAAESSILFEISNEVFLGFIKSSPEIMYDIFITFDMRLRHHNDLVVDQYLELEKRYRELKDTHIQLLQTEKLASIGMLTTGIAHEINNPLTVLMGYVDVLKDKVSGKKLEDDLLKKALDRMHGAAEAIKRIVVGLKTYVRVDTEEKAKIKLNETIQSSIDLVSYLYGKENILIETELCDTSPEIIGNVGKLQQVIMNLLSNARDAMENKEKKMIKIETKASSKAVTIKFSDTGSGIPEENLKKIFDKFYTTKQVGKGTGLGLEIIKSIVEDMEGVINVDSKVGAGTTFSLTFPGL